MFSVHTPQLWLDNHGCTWQQKGNGCRKQEGKECAISWLTYRTAGFATVPVPRRRASATRSISCRKESRRGEQAENLRRVHFESKIHTMMSKGKFLVGLIKE
jgi:hypothetical protein